MSPSPDELDALWEILADDVDDNPAPLSAHDLSTRSFAALAESVAGQIGANWRTLAPPSGRGQARLRLFGPAVTNSGGGAPVRIATQVLTHVQDAVAALAMSAGGKTSLFGSVPSEIRRRTELLLFPRPALGSVVFEVTPPATPDRSDELRITDGTTVADQAATDLTSILQMASDGSHEILVQTLQSHGPRVATHLRKLAAVSRRDDVYLDIEWQQGNGQRIQGSLGQREADYLVEVINESRATVEPQVLPGTLVTISTEESLALRLGDGQRIPMTASPDLDVDSLAGFFNKPILATVDVEITSHPVTGRDTRRYELIAVSEALTAEWDDGVDVD